MPSNSRLAIRSVVAILLLAGAARAQSLVPEQLKSACAFVMDGDNPKGSGFFVRVPRTGVWMTYFVTAQHVAVAGNYADPAARLRLRLNSHDGRSAKVVEVPLMLEGATPWFRHDNPGVDLAVFPMAVNWPKGLYDVLFLDCHNPGDLAPAGTPSKLAWVGSSFNFATELSRRLWNVGVGAETITVGLVPGLAQPSLPNTVVYRFGRIAAVPEFDIPLLGGAARTIILSGAGVSP